VILVLDPGRDTSMLETERIYSSISSNLDRNQKKILLLCGLTVNLTFYTISSS